MSTSNVLDVAEGEEGGAVLLPDGGAQCSDRDRYVTDVSCSAYANLFSTDDNVIFPRNPRSKFTLRGVSANPLVDLQRVTMADDETPLPVAAASNPSHVRDPRSSPA
jgi:hypothetical protein